MVFVLKEKKARKIFEKYDNVAAFTCGKSKGISEEDLEISYSKLTALLPDEDDINAVLDGTLKAKKVIKTAVKALRKPSVENRDICISMAQIINILSPEGKRSKKQEKKLRKSGPNIVVFVLDNVEEGDKRAAARNKFLVKYLAGIFGEFGIEPISDGKVVKKLFKGKRKKIVARVVDFIQANKKVRINDKGHILKKTLFTFYAIELRQSALRGLEIDDLSKQNMKTLLTTLIDTFTNDNMKVASLAKKDDVKKICKMLKEKNAAAVDAYKSFVQIMPQASPDLELPEVKLGYKKGKDKPKMDVDKFVKFFTKKKCKNAGLLLMVYAHISAVLMDAVPGTAEYTKIMSGTIAGIGAAEGYSKTYTAAAKAWAKEA